MAFDVEEVGGAQVGVAVAAAGVDAGRLDLGLGHLRAFGRVGDRDGAGELGEAAGDPGQPQVAGRGPDGRSGPGRWSRGRAAGAAVPAARSRATVPGADPLAVTTAVRAAGEYPGAITIAV